MDKRFLLVYTSLGHDGFRHSFHAWFETEAGLRTHVEEEQNEGRKPEVDLAIEILDYRSIVL